MSTNEWFTPSRFIQAVHEVLGGIDLDPASCEVANRVVQATTYYTKEQNGLMQPWRGRIFLNPPYGKTEQGKGSNLEYFTRRLVEQYQCGNVQEAILLIPANTATKWFDALWQFPICFPYFRVRFYNEQGPSDGMSFGTCFVYMGCQEQRFINVFQKFGRIVRAIDQAPRPVSQDLWKGDLLCS